MNIYIETDNQINLNNQTYQSNPDIIPHNLDNLDNLKLTNPYFVYPNGPLCEYTFFNFYNEEVKRLLVYLENLLVGLKSEQSNSNNQLSFYTLNSIILGSAMEQSIRIKNCNTDAFFQWQQLFPSYINNFISIYKPVKTNRLIVNLIIISPDKIFSDTEYREPLFITCSGYEFKKISNRKYIYSEDNLIINVDIFNCPFPSNDTRDYVKKMNDFLLSKREIFACEDLESYIQTPNDKYFLERFYRTIELIFEQTNYYSISTIINSWETFKNLTGYSQYTMFKKLLELSNQYNILATEWNFIDNLFITQIISRFSINKEKKIPCAFKSLIYVDENYCGFDIEEALINIPLYTGKRFFVIVFGDGINIYELKKD